MRSRRRKKKQCKALAPVQVQVRAFLTPWEALARAVWRLPQQEAHRRRRAEERALLAGILEAGSCVGSAAAACEAARE